MESISLPNGGYSMCRKPYRHTGRCEPYANPFGEVSGRQLQEREQ